ncbi:MAG: class I SAM-dependent methyltransferase [Bryobacterales bacterium]|nr:class I SAM-dependent methyltransferase [Bryobacterales bacterium]
MRSVWERRASLYDLCEGSDLRRGMHKKALFGQIRGRTLFLAIGTGIDIRHLPVGPLIVGIDISRAMLEKSRRRAVAFAGNLQLVQGDAMGLCFRDSSFDTIVTSCTMCSVPDPARVFHELRRVLKPGGRLLMFEHVRSCSPVLGAVLDLMTIVTRRGGTEMNRHTLSTAMEAGFRILAAEPIFLDIILAVEAVKDEADHRPIGQAACPDWNGRPSRERPCNGSCGKPQGAALEQKSTLCCDPVFERRWQPKAGRQEAVGHRLMASIPVACAVPRPSLQCGSGPARHTRR